MSKEAHDEARRRNAAKSTGPKTEAGKAVSRLNGMKHGLYSAVTLIEGESESELVAFGKRLRADLAPVGELEVMLADKVVATSWRLRRILSVEGALYEAEAENRISHVFGGYNGDRMLRMSRHEATLERALYRALHELQRLQENRAGGKGSRSRIIDVTLADMAEDDTAEEPEELASLRQNGLISVVESFENPQGHKAP